jgi:hypothetical protein
VGLGALGAAFMDALRLAVREACAADHTDRHIIARRLGVPFKTFEKWLSPTELLAPRFDFVLDLVVREDVLPPESRAILWNFLDREGGRVTVSALAADADEAPVPQQLLEIVAADGDLADAVRRAVAATSAGGNRITAGEAAALLPFARAAKQQGDELVATLEGLAASKGGR